MVLVKILGGIDLAAAFALLMLIFGIRPFAVYLIFCALLLVVKGMFILSGDVLSAVDIFSSGILFLSIIVNLPVALFWIPAFLMMAKGIMSFL